MCAFRFGKYAMIKGTKTKATLAVFIQCAKLEAFSGC